MDFFFTATTPEGSVRSGEISANNIDAARFYLRQQNLSVARIRILNKARSCRLHLREYYELMTELTQLLGVGIPLAEALTHCSHHASSKRVAEASGLIAQQLQRGLGMQRAITLCLGNLPPYITTQLAMAEKNGTTTTCFRRISEDYCQKLERRNTIRKALLSPVITIATALAVLLFMIYKLLPTIADLYSDERSLPAITRFYLKLGEELNQPEANTSIIIAVAAAIGAIIMLTRQTEIPLKIPVIKSLFRAMHLQSTLHHLSLLLKSDTDIDSALSSTIAQCHSKAYRRRLENCLARVRQGAPLSQALKACWLPASCHSLIAISEKCGTLASMLEHCAHELDKQNMSKIDASIRLVQPIATLLTGIFIATIIAAMYLPLFELSENI